MMKSSCLVLALAACGSVEAPHGDAPPPDTTGECTVDTDCAGDHTVCVTNACTCAAGFTANAGGGCEWTGVIADPGFADPSAWTLTGGQAIDPTLNESGMRDPGALSFLGGPTAGLCSMRRVTQQITMPKRSRSGPLVMEVTSRDAYSPFPPPTLAVGVGAGWRGALAVPSWDTSRFCLGAAQYAAEATTGPGAPLTLAFMPSRRSPTCQNPDDRLDVDRIDILPANPGECPATGQVINGDAEGNDGWDFSPPGNGVYAGFAAGIGENGSRAVQLVTADSCGLVSASAPVSIPTADVMRSPALSFYRKASDRASLYAAAAWLPGDGVGGTTRVCLPASQRGIVTEFVAQLDGIYGACDAAANSNAVVDSVALVDDPACGTDVRLTDPGFESSYPAANATGRPATATVRTLNDPARAHSGHGVLELATSSSCGQPSWLADAVTPPASGTAGPALVFFYRAAPGAQSYLKIRNTSSGQTVTATQDGQWHAGRICLDPALEGRGQRVSFGLPPKGDSCFTDTPIATETAYIDDLSVTTDPTCPAM